MSVVQLVHEKASLAGFLAGELNTQRLAGELCDVILTIGERRFYAHRGILAAHSPYFRAMFTNELAESGKTIIPMDESIPDEEALEVLIDFFYLGKITINEDNAQSLLAAADLLLLEAELKNKCCTIVKTGLTAGNCLGIWLLADQHTCEDLINAAFQFALNSFKSVAKQAEFLHLSLAQILKLLKSDQLAAESEEAVFKAAMSWVRHDEASRKSHLAEILTSVRLTMCSAEFLAMTIDKDELIQSSSEECRHAIAEAIQAKNRQRQQQPPPAKKRRTTMPSAVVEPPMDEPRTPLQRQTLCIFADRTTGDNSGGDDVLKKTPLIVVQGLTLSVAVAGVDRSDFAVVMLDDRIFLFGSRTNGQRTMDSYNTSSHQWTPVAPMSTARSRHCAVVLGGQIYAIGGIAANDDVTTTAVERYDPASDKWALVAPLATARAGSAAVTLGNSIYVLGGRGRTGRLMSSVERFDLSSGRWSAATSMRTPRESFGCVVFDGKIFVAGGLYQRYKSDEPLSSVECFDPVTRKWTDKGDLHDARYECSLAVVEGRLLAIGCGSKRASRWMVSHRRIPKSIKEYEPTTNSWRHLCNLENLTNDHHHSVCVVPALFAD